MLRSNNIHCTLKCISMCPNCNPTKHVIAAINELKICKTKQMSNLVPEPINGDDYE